MKKEMKELIGFGLLYFVTLDKGLIPFVMALTCLFIFIKSQILSALNYKLEKQDEQ